MRIIIRLIVAVAVIAAAVYGGLWGYSWYKVKSAMDRAVKDSESIVELSYASVYVSPKLDGTVGVDGIVIKPKISSDIFKIQSVRFKFPSFVYLITAKKDDVPESMRLSVTGINIDLNSPLFASLSAMQKEAGKARGKQRNTGLMSYETLGCGTIEAIGIDELIGMGYQTMELDMDMDYRYAKVKNLLNLSSVVRIKGMQSVDIKAEMRVPPSELIKSEFANIVIDSVRVEVNDNGYAALRNRFCAAQLASTEEDYLGRNIEGLSRELGATFPLDTVNAYKKVMQGARLSVEIAPEPGTELTALGQYAVKDVIDILGVKLTLDSHTVDFKKFEWGKSYSAAHTEGGDDEQATNAAAASQPIAKPAHVPATYHATSPSKLERYVGYKVRLKTRSGVDRDGIISSAEGGVVTLRQTVSAGKGFISFPISLGDIKSAEVLY